MKPSTIITILIKATLIPLFAMFALSRWNICDYITFIPEHFRFEAGLALYMAILEAVVEIVEYVVEQRHATITCIFYDNERREDSNTKPAININSSGMDVASVWCHIVLDGRWKQLKELQIILDVPNWFSIQPDKTGIITQANGKVIWNIAELLPNHDNGTKQHLENRMKLSFIRNSPNAIEIDLEPTINKKAGKEFTTNGLTIRNME